MATIFLTDQEKVDIRRYCGYIAYGDKDYADNSSTGWRYFQFYGLLENRMNHLSDEEVTTVRDIYLTAIRSAESYLMETGDNLDTEKASVWVRNKAELRDKEAFYRLWCYKLCTFLGIPYMPYPNPAIEGMGTFCREI